MGYGDNPELTPSDAEVALAEEHTRRILARYGEPAALEPPPDLAHRVVNALPPSRRPLRPLPLRVGVWAAAAALLLALGTWGALGAGAGAAGQAVTPDSMLGQLTHTLATSPLRGPLLVAGLAVILVALAVAGGIWLWRHIWRKTQ